MTTKKLFCVVMSAILCVSLFAGCSPSPESLKYSVPHNSKIDLSETQENVVKADNLKESGKNDGWYYGNSKVSFGGFTFSEPSYNFKENQINLVTYYCNDVTDQNAARDKLIKYFSNIYGDLEDPEAAYWTVKLVGGHTYTISLQITAGDGSIGVVVRKKE